MLSEAGSEAFDGLTLWAEARVTKSRTPDKMDIFVLATVDVAMSKIKRKKMNNCSPSLLRSHIQNIRNVCWERTVSVVVVTWNWDVLDSLIIAAIGRKGFRPVCDLSVLADAKSWRGGGYGELGGCDTDVRASGDSVNGRLFGDSNGWNRMDS
jgi:hypothetical protein